MTRTGTTKARAGAAIVGIAPVVLLAGFISHPHIGMGPPDEATIAAAVTSNTLRWGVAHLTVALASGFVLLAFLAIRSYLRDANEERFSPLAVPFIVIGSTLFAVLPGMEMAPLVVAETGGDVQAAQAALVPWFITILMLAAFTFAIGAVGFAKGIADSGVLSQRLTWLVVGALTVMASSRFVPLSAVQFYVQGVAGIVALWPLAYDMWAQPEARPVGQRRTMPRGAGQDEGHGSTEQQDSAASA
jgi:hypothetical protein